MARYNREFLVPYLHDICALYLADKRISNRYDNLNDRVRALRKGISNPRPEYIADKPGVGTYVLIALGLFFRLGLLLH